MRVLEGRHHAERNDPQLVYVRSTLAALARILTAEEHSEVLPTHAPLQGPKISYGKLQLTLRLFISK